MTIQANFPAIKPSLLLDFANTKQLDSRITYTRASTASYYDGVTTSMAEQNLLLQSQTFNTTWALTRTTLPSSTQTAPDGTSTAYTLQTTATTNNFNILQTLATLSGIVTFSCYFKAGTNNYVALLNNGDANAFANFDLSTGVLGTVGSKTTATITAVGSGWYRCVATYNATTTYATSYQILIIPSATTAYGASWTAAGTETILLWGAQVEQRSAVSAYTATTTQAITNYIPKLQSAASGVARFDNNPTTGESLGLLIEETRTNLTTYSSDFSNAAWTKTNASIDSNTIVAPDGTLTGDKLVEDTATGNHQVQQGGITISASTTYTVTTYAKAAGRDWLFIFDNNNPSAVQAYFNVSTGALGTIGGSATATITSVGNSWYRCSVTFATGPSQSSINLLLRTASANGTTSYTGNGFSGLFLWGTQVEAGAFATSYIPTVASQVTRAADAASMTGTNFSTWFNAGEGTMYVEANPSQPPSSYGTVCMAAVITDTSSYTNAIRLERVSGSARVVQTVNGSSQVFSSSWTTGVSGKLISAYKANDSAATFNAATATALTGNAPSNPILLGIGSNGTSNNFFGGTIKKISYYPIRLSNTNLVALTS